MAVQTIERSGGRRFGPTATAARRPGAAPAVPTGHVAGRGRRAGDLTARPTGTIGGATRPPSGVVPGRRPAAVAACPASSAAGGYRMGRWARLAMTLVVTAALVVGTITLIARPDQPSTRLVTVQPGDTLWSIVLRDTPGMDPVDAVSLIESLNGLDGPTVRVGTVLRVPAG